MNPHWPRWIFASAADVFKQRCSPLSFYVEGDERKTESESEYVEFRLDGPYFQQTSPSKYNCTIEINVLVVCKKNDRNIYTIQTNVGIVAAAFKEFSIFKFGLDSEIDDESLVECMILETSNDIREALRISHFGIVDPGKNLIMASVEGHYRAILTG